MTLHPYEDPKWCLEYPLRGQTYTHGEYQLLGWMSAHTPRVRVCTPDTDILKLAERIFGEDAPVDMPEAYRVQVVRPPAKLAAAYARGKLVWEEEHYRRALFHPLDALPEDEPLPTPFAPCFGNDPPTPALRGHDGCPDCVQGVRLCGTTYTALYLKNRERLAYYTRPDAGASLEDAPQANESDPLLAVIVAGGEARILRLLPEAYRREEDLRGLLQYPLLGLFRIVEFHDIAPYYAMADRARAQYLAEQEAARRAYSAPRTEDARRNLRHLLGTQ